MRRCEPPACKTSQQQQPQQQPPRTNPIYYCHVLSCRASVDGKGWEGVSVFGGESRCGLNATADDAGGGRVPNGVDCLTATGKRRPAATTVPVLAVARSRRLLLLFRYNAAEDGAMANGVYGSDGRRRRDGNASERTSAAETER
ncbi:unnamed protein product [Lampetra planeri]